MAEQSETTSGFLERRAGPRKPTVDIIFYSDTFKELNPFQTLTSHVGTTVDMSSKGFCIVTERPFSRGSRIKIAFKALGSASVVATVRWCQKSTDKFYRVGLLLS